MTTMLLASTGGHLDQLHQLRRRLLPPGTSVVWVTFDTPQSRSLLAGEVVEYVPYLAPRSYMQVGRTSFRAHSLLRKHRVTRLCTTGSGIALSFLPAARALRVQCHYIESAARSQGPSLTGRLAAVIPGVKTYTQYRTWSTSRWVQAPSVFDDFRPSVRDTPGIKRVVVTLGTIQGFGFPGLIDRLSRLLPADAEVTWQTGDTDVSRFPIQGRTAMPQAELAEVMERADLVVAHAGVGSALTALRAGRIPVLVPRRSSRGEHVDDHQTQIATELAGRGLAVHRELEQLTMEDLVRAAGLGAKATADESAGPFLP